MTTCLDDFRIQGFLGELQPYFSPERKVLEFPNLWEFTDDPLRTKAGLIISLRDETSDTATIVVGKSSLTLRWEPKFRRVYHQLKYNTKGIKDPTWEEEARLFSQAHRRGFTCTQNGLMLKILDVDRSGHHARKHGYNDTYVVRFS